MWNLSPVVSSSSVNSETHCGLFKSNNRFQDRYFFKGLKNKCSLNIILFLMLIVIIGVTNVIFFLEIQNSLCCVYGYVV